MRGNHQAAARKNGYIQKYLKIQNNTMHIGCIACHVWRHAGLDDNIFQQEFPSMSVTRCKLISAVQS